MKMLHAACKGHVTLAVGIVWCPRTNRIYWHSRRAFGIFQESEEYTDLIERLESAIACSFSATFSSCDCPEIREVRDNEDMPGMDGTGLPITSFPGFLMRKE